METIGDGQWLFEKVTLWPANTGLRSCAHALVAESGVRHGQGQPRTGVGDIDSLFSDRDSRDIPFQS